MLEFQPTSEAIPAVFHLPTALGIEAVGLLLGFLMYRRVDIATVGVGGGARLHARNLYYVDRIYEAVTVHAGGRLARGFARFDREGSTARSTGSAARSPGWRVRAGDCRPASCATTRWPCWPGRSSSACIFVAAFAGGGS